MKTIELTDEEVAMLQKDLTIKQESCEEYLASTRNPPYTDYIEYELRLAKSILEKL